MFVVEKIIPFLQNKAVKETLKDLHDRYVITTIDTLFNYW